MVTGVIFIWIITTVNVIQPMLIDVLAVMKEHKVEGADFL